jgi:MFS family permease
MSPTAILWGKRPVYLGGIILFTLASIWCALSPSYASLVVARIVQGFAVSPVECLPSATIAEIFFLHERAYRLGIYTLLLLGGKNLIPLVSAVIVQSLGWRWVFWITFSLFLKRSGTGRLDRPIAVNTAAAIAPTGTTTSDSHLRNSARRTPMWMLSTPHLIYQRTWGKLSQLRKMSEYRRPFVSGLSTMQVPPCIRSMKGSRLGRQ